MKIASDVWKRVGDDHAMSRNLFAFLVCFWTVVGIFASATATYIARDWHVDVWGIIGVLVVSIAGVFIAHGSKNPLVSLVGYMMVTIPFGLVTGPVVALYTTASVFKILWVTLGMVTILGVIGAVIPQSLESWGIFLLGALGMFVVGSFIVLFAGMIGIPIEGAMTALDWIGVFLFGGLVIFDLNQAMRIERTHDNAIDAAVGIYLDIANIFLRLLDLFGDRK
ncbi:MAG: hypothetical protein UU48_C0014G0009 [Candidatus Uhrbacteria bacterium GW2011_GWF2_41_16]|uniref:Uncharacterized protein n=1 Tax=Candidatus Uhrbacteria bacterium GW2011_GWF2_41_16 TaxID=1618997 RepID=A0A0G0VCT4_9BACT|nr:MAG: hypothetical protein UU31_C0009G0010 [Candidatus Uhrbacteria bacterium GW2011_GWA2_41_10]KKR97476.1 MAG: hypothetical protein UU48_C0014G0009 [Candidatus Uhrbacteria bacterium GW2011_GWF2_41_16]